MSRHYTITSHKKKQTKKSIRKSSMGLKYFILTTLFLCSFISAIQEHLARLMRESQNILAMDFSQHELNLFLTELDKVQQNLSIFILKVNSPKNRNHFRYIGQVGTHVVFGVHDVERMISKLRSLVETGQMIKQYIDGDCQYCNRNELAHLLRVYDQKLDEIIRMLDLYMPGRSIRNMNDILQVITIFYLIINKSFSAKPTAFLVFIASLFCL